MEYLTNYKHPNKPSLVVLTGSHLYGVTNEYSDMDYRGFTLPTADQVFGLENFEQHESKDPDVVIYNYTKFLNLVERGSPNMTELLFVPKDNILVCDTIAQQILDNREKFISRKWVSAYIGFSESEIQKYAYDRNNVKSAYHAVRILSYIRDILFEKQINFKDTQVIELLKKIRNETISYTDVLNQYSCLFQLVKDLERKNPFPENPDREFIKDMKREVYYSIIKSA